MGVLKLRNTMLNATEISKQPYPLIVEDDKYYITRKYDGLDTLTFEIDSNQEYRDYIAEEATVETEDNIFTVKNIDEHSDFLTVDCIINLDDWKERFWHTYRQTEMLLLDAVYDVKPDGWLISMDAEYTEKKTVEASDGEPVMDANSLTLLYRICEIWGCVVNFDTKRKIVHVINPEEYGDSGDYYSKEINLNSIGYTGNSADFATRLYPYGAVNDETGEYLTIEEVNNGVPYVEDRSYCDKVVSVGFTDERYTNPASLYNAALEKLHEMAKPVRSYELNVRDVSQETKLYETCTVLDGRKRVKHTVVEYKEYPHRHDLDSIVLSAVVPDIGANLLLDESRWETTTVTVDNIQKYIDKSDLNAGGVNNKYGAIRVQNSYGRTNTKIDKDGASFGTTDDPTNVDINGGLTVNGKEITGDGGGGLPLGNEEMQIDEYSETNTKYSFIGIDIKDTIKKLSLLRVMKRKALSDGSESYFVRLGEPINHVVQAVAKILNFAFGYKSYNVEANIDVYGTETIEGPKEEETETGVASNYYTVKRHSMNGIDVRAGKWDTGKNNGGTYNVYGYKQIAKLCGDAFKVTSSAETDRQSGPTSYDYENRIDIGDESSTKNKTFVHGRMTCNGPLVFRDTNGGYYQIMIDGEGKITAQSVAVT